MQLLRELMALITPELITQPWFRARVLSLLSKAGGRILPIQSMIAVQVGKRHYAGTRWDLSNLNTPDRRVGGAVLVNLKPLCLPKMAYIHHNNLILRC